MECTLHNLSRCLCLAALESGLPTDGLPGGRIEPVSVILFLFFYTFLLQCEPTNHQWLVIFEMPGTISSFQVLF